MDISSQQLPMVSVGMPTYNRPQELRRALKAVVEQTYPNLEIIVSDNASPGNEVAEVVREFMSVDKRIQFFSQSKNFGPQHNFQFVLDKAEGEYFMWASDDDWRATTFVEELVRSLINHPASPMAFCNFIAAYETGEPVHYYPDFYRKMKHFTVSTMVRRQLVFFLQSGLGGKANLFYSLFRRQLLADFSFDDFILKSGSFGADMHFVYWMLGKGPLALSEKCLYRSTVGNRKQYLNETTGDARVMGTFRKAVDQIMYACRFLLISTRPQQFLVGVCLPIKIIQLIGAALRRNLEQLLKRNTAGKA